MKLALRLHDPSPDWIALRKVIEDNPTLREDITLEVGEEHCRFLDASGQELASDGAEILRRGSVGDVDGKMKLLTMLHERFSAQYPREVKPR